MELVNCIKRIKNTFNSQLLLTKYNIIFSTSLTLISSDFNQSLNCFERILIFLSIKAWKFYGIFTKQVFIKIFSFFIQRIISKNNLIST